MKNNQNKFKFSSVFLVTMLCIDVVSASNLSQNNFSNNAFTKVSRATPAQSTQPEIGKNASTNSKPDLQFSATRDDGSKYPVQGSIGDNSSKLEYRDADSIASLTLGIGYLHNSGREKDTKDKKYSKNRFGFQIAGATMLGDNFALGSTFSFYKHKKDLGLNAVAQLGSSGFRLKAAALYSWGNQEFNFLSGKQDVKLAQTGFLLGGQYAVLEQETIGLHSIGASIWGASAKQKQKLSPVIFIESSHSDFQAVMEDSRKLSLGRLQGAAIDVQAALHENLVTRLSIGREKIKFPFANKTQEKTSKAYYDLSVYFEPTANLLLSASYKAGASDATASIAAQSHGWNLGFFHTKGQNGLSGNKGVSLSYNLLHSSNSKASSLSLASRMRPASTISKSQLLAEAASRPSNLPNTFLAKVDNTNVKTLSRINKKITKDSLVTKTGDLLILVGDDGSNLNITSVSLNGSDITTPDYIKVDGKHLHVITTKLPEPKVGTDVYHVSVTDSNDDNSYLVTITADADAQFMAGLEAETTK